MKRELQEQLFKSYPKIFIQKGFKPSQTSMCFGIDCPDSWYPILDSMCCQIQRYIDYKDRIFVKYPFGYFLANLFKNSKLIGRWVEKDIKQIEFIQVKEKFGILRAYTNYSNPIVDNIIDMAENLTTWICADCGSFDNVKENNSGWVQYLCEECRGK